MADDFIAGYPPIVTIAGSATTWVVTWAKGEWDEELFASFIAATDYVGNVTQADTPLIIASNDGEQSDGTYDITITGDASAWVSATDRCSPKVGVTLSHYTTIALAKAAMNGTTERMLIGYSSTTGNIMFKDDQIGSTSGGYNMWGLLPGARIKLYSGQVIYEMTGDCSGVANVRIKNISLGAAAANAFYYHASSDVSGVVTVERCRMLSGLQLANVTTTGSDKVQFLSCLFTGVYDLKHAYFSASVLLENCVFAGGEVDLVSKASTVKNCYSIDTTWSNTGSATITTCRSTDAGLGSSLSIVAAGMWFTNSETDGIEEYAPYSSGSGLLAIGTAGTATVGFHGQDLATPPAVGIGEVLVIVTSTADYPAEADVRVGVDFDGVLRTGTYTPDGGIAIPTPQSTLIADTTLTTICAAPTTSAYTNIVAKVSIANSGVATTGYLYALRGAVVVVLTPSGFTLPAGDTVYPIYKDVPVVLESTDVLKFQQAGTSALAVDVSFVETL